MNYNTEYAWQKAAEAKLQVVRMKRTRAAINRHAVSALAEISKLKLYCEGPCLESSLAELERTVKEIEMVTRD